MESLDTIIVNRLACRVENLLDKELQGPALERGPGGVALTQVPQDTDNHGAGVPEPNI